MDHIYTVLWHKVRSMAVHAVLCGTSVAAHPMHANNLPLFDDMTLDRSTTRPWTWAVPGHEDLGNMHVCVLVFLFTCNT
jgi:hypothetical protein